jgi:L,D-peptidoglycan transpeptidase YkuD (ErfK/YbiS/YcfS/YnhG family)
VRGRAVLLLLACGGGAGCGAPSVACPPSNAAHPFVFVDTRRHGLALCEHDRAASVFSVRLGHRGTGKTREGDGKTPLGEYPIASSVPSSDYGLVIPIGYPTPAQHRQGFTGSAIGVHGPIRRARWLGHLVNLFDTTDGCVGVATDDEMDRIASWVRDHDVRWIRIE